MTGRSANDRHPRSQPRIRARVPRAPHSSRRCTRRRQGPRKACRRCQDRPPLRPPSRTHAVPFPPPPPAELAADARGNSHHRRRQRRPLVTDARSVFATSAVTGRRSPLSTPTRTRTGRWCTRWRQPPSTAASPACRQAAPLAVTSRGCASSAPRVAKRCAAGVQGSAAATPPFTRRRPPAPTAASPC